MHCHLQTKGRLRIQVLPPLDSLHFQIRFRCRRMSQGGHRRFDPPPPRRIRGQRSPHQWCFLPRETPGFLFRQHRQNYRHPRGACASVSYSGWFASQ